MRSTVACFVLEEREDRAREGEMWCFGWCGKVGHWLRCRNVSLDLFLHMFRDETLHRRARLPVMCGGR